MEAYLAAVGGFNAVEFLAFGPNFVVLGVLGGGLMLFIEQTFALIWAHGVQMDFESAEQEAEAMEAVNNLYAPRFEAEEALNIEGSNLLALIAWRLYTATLPLVEELNIEWICDPLDCPEPMGLWVDDLVLPIPLTLTTEVVGGFEILEDRGPFFIPQEMRSWPWRVKAVKENI